MGDGTADDTLALQRALDGEGRRRGVLVVPPGVYRMQSLTIPSGVVLDLRQARLLVVGRQGGYALTIGGSHADTGFPLTADAAEGATSVAVATDDTIRAGAHVVLRASAGERPEATEGELKVVREATAGQLTFTTALTRSYAIARQAVVALAQPAMHAGVTGGIIDIQSSATAGGGILIDLATGCFVRDVSITGASDRPAISVQRSTLFDLAGNRIRNGQSMLPPDFGRGWVIDAWSHHGWVRGNYAEGVQENVIGREVRQVTVSGNVCHGARLGGIVVRGAGARGIVISGNTISGTQSGPALSLGQIGQPMTGGSITVSANVLRENRHAGIQVAGTQAAPARDILLEGNLIDGYGEAAPSLAGVFVFEADRVRLTGNTIRRGVTGAGARGLQIVRSRNIAVERTHIAGIRGIGLEIEASAGVEVSEARLRDVEGVALRTIGTNPGLSIRRSGTVGGRVMLSGTALQQGNDWQDQPRSGRIAAELASGEKRALVTVRLDPPLKSPEGTVVHLTVESADGEGITASLSSLVAQQAVFEIADSAFWTPRKLRKVTLHWAIDTLQ